MTLISNEAARNRAALAADGGAALVNASAWYAGAIAGFNATKVPDGATVIFSGRFQAIDGCGGTFQYVKASTQADDGVNVITPALGGGRLIRAGWTLYGFAGPMLASYFGIKGDSVTDNTARMAQARNWLAAQASQAHRANLTFTAGRYKYTESPNWAISNAEICAVGEVRFNNTGTGNTVIIDGGESAGGVSNLKFGVGTKFIIEGAARSANGVYARAILQGCHLGFQVVGAGTDFNGLRVDFAVCAIIDIVVSNNVDNFTWYSRPKNGIFLSRRGEGELCSYCTFNTPILEGVRESGAILDWAFGNNFFGGTMEGCGSVGALLTVNAFINNFYGVDYEVNTDHDIYCLGRENNIFFCSTEKRITFDGYAKNNNVVGGSHQQISMNANTFGNVTQSLTYNRNGGGGEVLDLSGANQIRDVRNAYVTSVPPTTTGIQVGASPFTYTNSSKKIEGIAIVGSGVTGMVLTHGGVQTSGMAANQIFELSPGDRIDVSFTGGISVNRLTR